MGRPQAFNAIMKTLLGEAYEAYESSFDEHYYKGFRLNPLKASEESPYIQALIEGKKGVPWCQLGYYDQGEDLLSKNPLYYGGFYYIQEPSAMTPVECLAIEPGMTVLDLCAAPGGKSTQIGGYLNGEGLLVSNDISSSRAYGLLKNIELFGIGRAAVFGEDGGKLSGYFTEFFDRVLVDAPCSGEGMFRKNPKMTADWEARGPEYYQAIQKEVVLQAVSMLKPGGLLVYSTCTFSEQENEAVIAWLLGQDSSLSLVDIPKEHGFEPGTSLKEVARLYPFKLQGEGHFVAKIQKAGQSVKGIQKPSVKKDAYKKQLNKKQLESFLTFCQEFFGTVPFEHLQVKKDNLYDFPLDIEGLKGLRAIRTGLLIGHFKRDRFEPAQPMAGSLQAGDVKQAYELSPEEMPRYFKGETLSVALDKGWYLVTIDQEGVGLAKSDGKKLKNKFNPSWVMQ